MRLVIEIPYCDYECSGTSTYPIEYESAEQLLVDLEEFYNETKKATADYWHTYPRKNPLLPADNFKGSGICTDELEERTGYDPPSFIAPMIHTVDEWFGRYCPKPRGSDASPIQTESK